jgi:hypothetical protein
VFQFCANNILTYQDLMIYHFGSASNGFRKKFGALEKPRDFRQSLDMRIPANKLPPARSHQWIDFVDLMVHRAMARKIRRKPGLFRRARRNIARWEKSNRGCPEPLREWKRIFREHDMNGVLRLITRADEEGNRLRQSSPFCGILTAKEREAIWARYDQG